MSSIRTRWAAIGAAIAVTVGAGGIGLVDAAKGSGERAVHTAYGPCRITDTRPNHAIGSKTGAFGPTETHTVRVWGTNGQCTGIPDDVSAVELNVTAVEASQLTHLTFWDDGPVPNASSLNPAPGQPPTPNAVTVNLASDGSFKVYNYQGNVHLIIDVVGIYQHHHHDDHYYTKAQVDAAIAAISTNPTTFDGYTKSEIDAYLAGKADAADVYTKQQIGNVIAERTGSYNKSMNIGDPPVTLAQYGPFRIWMECASSGGNTVLSIKASSTAGPWYTYDTERAAGFVDDVFTRSAGNRYWDYWYRTFVVPSAGVIIADDGYDHGVFLNYPGADCRAAGTFLPSFAG